MSVIAASPTELTDIVFPTNPKVGFLSQFLGSRCQSMPLVHSDGLKVLKAMHEKCCMNVCLGERQKSAT